MQSFCAVFNYSNLADTDKDKSNDCFPLIAKNNGKEGLELSKVRREKWLAQIFRKDLTERKLVLHNGGIFEFEFFRIN